MVDDAGQNAIAVLPGANANLRADDVERVALGAGDVVVAQLEVPEEPIIRAFERARAMRARTLLNAAPARALPEGLLALTDILVVNETEAAALANVSVDDVSSAARAAVRLRSSGPAAVAVTLGEQGAVLAGGETRWHIPPYRVQAVDSTAAGDAWVGALAAELCAGRELLDAAVFASAAGALTTTRKGAQAALPDRTEVERARRHVPPPQLLPVPRSK
jgi:ribokinase